jgi:hypothetical protein
MTCPGCVFVVGSGWFGATPVLAIFNSSDEVRLRGESLFLNKGPSDRATGMRWPKPETCPPPLVPERSLITYTRYVKGAIGVGFSGMLTMSNSYSGCSSRNERTAQCSI